MAVGAGSDGVFETVLRAKDEASPVVKEFAETSKTQLGGASKAVKETSEESDKAVSKLGERASVVAKAVGIAALAASAAAATMVKNVLEQADAVSKASRQTGFSTESLGAWQYQAGIAGVEADKLTKLLDKFGQNLNRAAEGNAKAERSFEALGLSAEELRKLGPEKAILAVADALDDVPTRYEKTRLAVELFGKSGAKMVEVLEGGSAAFAASYQEAERFGLLIDGKTGKAAEQFNDNIDRLKRGLGGVAIQVASPLLEPLAAFSEVLLSVGKKTLAFKTAGEGLVLVLKGLAGGLVVIGGLAASAGNVIGGTAAALAAIINRDFGGAKSIIQQMGKDISDITEKSRKLINDFFKPVAYVPPDSPAGFFRKVANLSNTPGVPGVYSDVNPGAQTTTPDAATAALSANARNDLAGQLRWIEESLKSEEDRIRESYDRRIATIDAAEALKLQTEKSYGELRTELESQREIELTRLHEQAARSRYQTLDIYNKLSLSSMQFFFSQMGALMQTKSRALFEIGKAGAVAETIIQTYRAAQGAYAAMASIPFVGPALGAAAAAAAIAVGFARVQAIRATNFGGASGSPVLSSGGTSGPVVATGTGVSLPPQSVATQPTLATPQQRVNITLMGTAFSASVIRDELIPLLNDALGDGVRLNVSTV